MAEMPLAICSSHFEFTQTEVIFEIGGRRFRQVSSDLPNGDPSIRLAVLE
jgi:hypothetical protein